MFMCTPAQRPEITIATYPTNGDETVFYFFHTASSLGLRNTFLISFPYFLILLTVGSSDGFFDLVVCRVSLHFRFRQSSKWYCFQEM